MKKYLSAKDVLRVLNLVLHDQPPIYVQTDGGKQKASQQEIVAVVIGRIADELAIQLNSCKREEK